MDNALCLLLLVRERGLVRVADAAEHRRYRPGPALGEARLAAAGPDLRSIARAHLSQLRHEVDETVHLMVLEGNGVRFIDGIESTKTLRVGSRVGRVLPAHCTSGGLVSLAELPAVELDALYYRGLPAAPGNAITSFPELNRRLNSVRRHRYATNRDESEHGISAVAVCVRSPAGRALGAVAVALPSARRARNDLPRVASILHDYADRMRAGIPST